MLPISIKQIKFTRESKIIADEIKKIKEKYKNDKEKMQTEIMLVQSKYLPKQLSGCLPLILQFIFLINIYHVISDIVQKGVESFNKVAYPFVSTFSENYSLNTLFLNIDLTNNPNNAFANSDTNMIGYVIIVIILGITQFLSTKTMFKPALDNSSITEQNSSQTSSDNQKKNSNFEEDFSEAMKRTQKQLFFLFPIMIVLISFSLPVGLTLYWIIQSVFAIIQQYFFNRFSNKINTN